MIYLLYPFVYISRCKDAIRNGVKIYIGTDNGKWHDLKKTHVHPDNQAPLVPISGWKTFPGSPVPKHFNYGHIYHYLVESLSAYDLTGDNSSDPDEDKNNDDDDVHSKPFTKGKKTYLEVDM